MNNLESLKKRAQKLGGGCESCPLYIAAKNRPDIEEARAQLKEKLMRIAASKAEEEN